MAERTRRLVSVVIAALACGEILAGPAQAGCERSRIFFNVGVPSVKESWHVDKNELCSHSIRSWGDLSVDNFTLSQRPLHGAAGVNNSIGDHGYAYRPAVGFVGADHFQVTLDQHNSKVSQRTTIDVDIEVVDKQ